MNLKILLQLKYKNTCAKKVETKAGRRRILIKIVNVKTYYPCLVDILRSSSSQILKFADVQKISKIIVILL